ncbi:hypothetical protein UFOVP509_18 [uncultured Caudovirales phage]|uniref:Uncharacterized protein n=1 Tax=uncultured Caudovirales phage TaxID=2100421 RepID=A0A6J5MP65_9CAUD|nr:hypothetical protein UFOVP509_18 [uncultured Caudovirales phage]
MPRCQLCGDIYLHAGVGGPAEDCKCGANATRETVRRMRLERVDSGSSDDPRDTEEA